MNSGDPEGSAVSRSTSGTYRVTVKRREHHAIWKSC
jgi:hypothetical protein